MDQGTVPFSLLGEILAVPAPDTEASHMPDGSRGSGLFICNTMLALYILIILTFNASQLK